MTEFSALFEALERTTRTSLKTRLMEDYFRAAPPEDALWALFYLSGQRPRTPVGRGKLRAWVGDWAGLPDWLVGECYDAVGDLAETLAKLMPDSTSSPSGQTATMGLAGWIEQVILPLAGMEEPQQRQAIAEAWGVLNSRERLTFNKLITGAFRAGVSKELTLRAYSLAVGLPPSTIAHRLMGDWQPDLAFWAELTAPEDAQSTSSRPYPFCLAHPLEGDLQELGPVSEWQVEWKWDGIRAQILVRESGVYIWSRGELLVNDAFPEIVQWAQALPIGTVLDGEILAWDEDQPAPFQQLQQRINRKKPGRAILARIPCRFLAYDLLEWQGADFRAEPLAARRRTLESLGIALSPVVPVASWDDVAQLRMRSREVQAEGLMIKSLRDSYVLGRKKGIWWKWKVQPLTVDAVLVYAQRGTGKRANLYTDYTFAVWKEGALVPFAKAYSGLNDQEIVQVDQFIRKNTQERFGPVRTVKPELVFEIGFEGIAKSARHKSGLAVRFPRILRWRKDKRAEDADSLHIMEAMI